MIENIDDIETKRKKPCLICGKMTNGEVCSQTCQDEWKRRNTKPKYKPLPVETMGSQPSTKQQIQNFNKNPDTQRLGVRVIKKSIYKTILGFAIFSCLLLSVLVIAYLSKDYGTTVDVNTPITVTPAQTNISNIYNNDDNYNNNHTINVYVDYQEISDMIADEVLEIINNKTAS